MGKKEPPVSTKAEIIYDIHFTIWKALYIV